MPIKLMQSLLVASAITLSSIANALPIQQADAFTTGDNKAALETSTGLVWLDFGITNDQTMSDVSAQLASSYAGWRLPTQSEVIHLWASLFGSLPGWLSFGTFGYVNNSDLASEFDAIYDIFNVNGLGEAIVIENEISTSTPILGSQGLFLLDNGNVGGAMMYRPTTNPAPGYTAFFYDSGDSTPLGWKHEFTSTLLVKDQPETQVPEPSTLLLLLGSLLVLWARATGIAFHKRS